MTGLPLLLTLLRFTLAPVVVLLGLFAPSRGAFAVCLVTAFLSDIFDGVLARRLGVATPSLRRLDSIADSLFYAATTFAVWHLNSDAITSRWPPLLMLCTLELGRYGFDFRKFGRETAYHMWSSKLWGMALFGAFFSLLALDKNGAIVDAAIYIGIAADLEGLAISLILRQWRHDVPTVFHALRLRDANTNPANAWSHRES